jgi:signal transduction histidine kinase
MFRFEGSGAIDMPGNCIFRSEAEYLELGRVAGPLLSQGKPIKQELYMRRQDGSEFWASLIGYVADQSDPTRGAWWIFDDRSDVKRAEESLMASYAELKAAHLRLEATQSQLLQSEKLASIGLLAAGVAHEINNPIGYVNSNLSTLKTYLSGLFSVIDAYEKAEIDLAGSTQAFSRVDSLKALVDLPYLKSDTPALMDESLGGLERVKKIVQSLLDFSHVDADDTWRLEDIHEGIESTLRVVSSELKNKCEIVREYGNMPPVECLISSLSQVFANLLTNAAHAIEEHGVVTIRTGSQVDKAWVEIADTGKGIAPEHLAHIFDPFFTTKPVGKGTGMGLSVSYSIVQRHHGLFDVTSEVGSGTTFRLWLPLKQPTWPAPVKASKT